MLFFMSPPSVGCGAARPLTCSTGPRLPLSLFPARQPCQHRTAEDGPCQQRAVRGKICLAADSHQPHHRVQAHRHRQALGQRRSAAAADGAAPADHHGGGIGGRLLLKRDSDLAIAGSVKARGGIYEILKHTEEIALEKGLLSGYDDDYAKLAGDECRRVFSQYTVQVGSTGNLGHSIGIMSAAVGYKVIVHMSADAKQWKKELLRSKGVKVVEYKSDYSEAVKRGRELSDADPMSYFVDDENSVALFLGYAVAAKRMKAQLEDMGIEIGENRPLIAYIPCGVGGAPGGIAFGLRLLFGDDAHVFFVEPTQAPCMLLGMASGLNNKICVQDVGLTGLTHADGLAVGRPSGFVGGVMKTLLAGEMTVEDYKLYDYMRALLDTEGIFIEPSSCAAFEGPMKLCSREGEEYIRRHGLEDKMQNAIHIPWATGGRLVPEEIRKEYMSTYLK